MDRFIPRADQLSSLDQISIQAQAAKMMTSYRSQEAAMELMAGLTSASSAAAALAQTGIGSQSRLALEAAMASVTGLAGAKSAAAALAEAGIGSQSRLALEAAMASVTGLAGAKSAAAALAQAGIGSQSRLALEAAMASVTGLAGASSAAAALAQTGIGSQSRLALEAAMASVTGLAGAKSAAAALGIEPYQSLVSASNTLLEIRNQFGDIRYAQEGLASNLTESEDVAQLISKATSEAQSIAESTGLLLSAIEAQPNLQSKLMLWMVTSYIVTKLFDAIFSHIAGLIVTAVIAANPSNALQPKQVKQAVSQVLGASDVLQDYRYVKADVLMVRKNPKAQSPVIAKFELGQTVLLIEKDKNGFSLVEWKDSESGVEIRGWVFTRYLAKFH